MLLASISQEGFNIKWRVLVFIQYKTSLKTATKLKKNSPNKPKKIQLFLEIWRFLKAKKWKFHDRIFSFCFDLSHFGVIWGKKEKTLEATQ